METGDDGGELVAIDPGAVVGTDVDDEQPFTVGALLDHGVAADGAGELGRVADGPERFVGLEPEGHHLSRS
jgi:hypothetical protein